MTGAVEPLDIGHPEKAVFGTDQTITQCAEGDVFRPFGQRQQLPLQGGTNQIGGRIQQCLTARIGCTNLPRQRQRNAAFAEHRSARGHLPCSRLGCLGERQEGSHQTRQARLVSLQQNLGNQGNHPFNRGAIGPIGQLGVDIFIEDPGPQRRQRIQRLIDQAQLGRDGNPLATVHGGHGVAQGIEAGIGSCPLAFKALDDPAIGATGGNE